MTASRLPWACGLAASWPHVLLPLDLLPQWRGIGFAEADQLLADRGVGLVSVGGRQGLLIGGEEMPLSTWLPLPGGRGVDLVVWLEGNLTDDAARGASRAIPAEALVGTGLTLTAGPEGMALFPAPQSWEDMRYGDPASRGYVSVPLAAGRYAVLDGKYESRDHLFRVCRLTRIDAEPGAAADGGGV